MCFREILSPNHQRTRYLSLRLYKKRPEKLCYSVLSGAVSIVGWINCRSSANSQSVYFHGLVSVQNILDENVHIITYFNIDTFRKRENINALIYRYMYYLEKIT